MSAGAACLVGAFMEGLISPLALESTPNDDESERLIDALVRFALRAISGREPAAGPLKTLGLTIPTSRLGRADEVIK